MAARILVDKRFKGDVMVVLRQWIIDNGHVQTFDFVSPPTIQEPFRLEKELDLVNREKSRYYVPIEKQRLLDMNF